jgi:hypothetical protein
MKIRRNEPCPCGSGKKYKKCCLNDEDFISSIKTFQPEETYDESFPEMSQKSEKLIPFYKNTIQRQHIIISIFI